FPEKRAGCRIERVDAAVEASEINLAGSDPRSREHAVGGGEVPELPTRIRVERQNVAVIRSDVQPSLLERGGGGAVVVAGFRVSDRQPVDLLLIHTDSPTLPAGPGVQLVEESVIGLHEDVFADDRRTRANGSARAIDPKRLSAACTACMEAAVIACRKDRSV